MYQEAPMTSFPHPKNTETFESCVRPLAESNLPRGPFFFGETELLSALHRDRPGNDPKTTRKRPENDPKTTRKRPENHPHIISTSFWYHNCIKLDSFLARLRVTALVGKGSPLHGGDVIQGSVSGDLELLEVLSQAQN